jgi:hypothetical protein
MRLILLTFWLFGALNAIAAEPVSSHGLHYNDKRENMCSLKSPPALCQPNKSITVEETAQRAYKFYRAFVVDGDPKTMFSLIDSAYIVGYRLRSMVFPLANNGSNITLGTPLDR